MAESVPIKLGTGTGLTLEQKVIIDADPGIGDALAIALALADPNIDVMAVTATAGRVSGSQASQNVQAIVELLDPLKWPRLGEADSDLANLLEDVEYSPFNAAALNGPTGLGECTFSGADLHNRRESAKLMIDIVRQHPNEVTLLALGPLTNVEVALERAPDFLELLGRIVCLGGTVEVGGDITAVAEFNMFANPTAARHILRSPATKTLIPLDVTHRVVLTFEHYNRLPISSQLPLGRLVGQLVPYALRANHQHLGQEGICLGEVVALAAIVEPRLMGCEEMAVDVETVGELTRGMTVFDRRRLSHWQTNIDVVREVDSQGILDYFQQIISRG